jgi:hypothetical protein
VGACMVLRTSYTALCAVVCLFASKTCLWRATSACR